MIGNALFLAGLLVSGALVWRGLVASWWRAYPVVFAYFVVLLFNSGAEWLLYTRVPALYARFYWFMEVVFVMFGFGLIWQVYAAIPQQYPGAGRMIKVVAQRIAAVAPLFLILAVLFATPGSMTLDLIERNFRLLHAALIVVVYGLAAYFGIPLSQNLQALLQGYGLYTAVFIVKFTLWPLKFQGAWGYILSVAFLASLIIWLVGLWRYKNPAADVVGAGSPDTVLTETRLGQLRKELHANFFGE